MGLKNENKVQNKSSNQTSIGFKSVTSKSVESIKSVSKIDLNIKNNAKNYFVQVPALTPEDGLPHDYNGLYLYDCCMVVITCSVHNTLAVTSNPDGHGLFLPFVRANRNEIWMDSAFKLIVDIITQGETRKIKDPVKYSEIISLPRPIQILRLQRPHDNQYVTRVTFRTNLTLLSDNELKCCQSYKDIIWLKTDDVVESKSSLMFGPEPKIFLEHDNGLEVIDYNLEDARTCKTDTPQRKKENDLIISVFITETSILKLYNYFIHHCYPSQYMSVVSFRNFMRYFGYNPEDVNQNLGAIFRSFAFDNPKYINFYELLLGLSAIDKSSSHHGVFAEIRNCFIFHFYDPNDDGFLCYQDLYTMTKDYLKHKDMNHNPEVVEKETKDIMTAMGLQFTDLISYNNYIKQITSYRLRGTSSLFRSPLNIVYCINNMKSFKSLAKSLHFASKRICLGSCPRCKVKHYKWAINGVKLDFNGLIIEPQVLEDKYVDKTDFRVDIEDGLTEQLRKYSRETVFNPKSNTNILLEMLRDFAVTCPDIRSLRSRKNKDFSDQWSSTDKKQLANLVMEICEGCQTLFEMEPRCIKVQSPIFVFGNICGNFRDLMIYERCLWRSGPAIIGSNYLFLGDFSGRGRNSIECITYLFALKLLAPRKYILCRGKHEIRNMQKATSFSQECHVKFGLKVEQWCVKRWTERSTRCQFALL